MGLPLIGAVGGVLSTLDLDDAVVDEILAALKEAQASVEGADFARVPGGAFGGSWTGGNLGHHTDLAHQKFLEAFVTMLDHLTTAEEGVVEARKDFHDTDGNIGDNLNVLRSRLGF